MKVIITVFVCLVLLLFVGCKSHPQTSADPDRQSLVQIADSSLVRREVAPNPDHPDRKNTVWLRNGVQIMSETEVLEDGSRLCVITPFDLKQGRAALAIWFKKGKISTIFNGPALDGYKFEIIDLTRNGEPNLIQILDRKTNKVIEAYTIINGIVEPLPANLLKEDRSSFDYDDEKLADFLKQKIKGQRR